MIDYPKMIKKYREHEFLTQTELAKILGVSLVSITRWETGHNEPTIKVKKKLYDLFIKAGIKMEDKE